MLFWRRHDIVPNLVTDKHYQIQKVPILFLLLSSLKDYEIIVSLKVLNARNLNISEHATMFHY